MKFRRKDNLNRHMRNSHPGNMAFSEMETKKSENTSEKVLIIDKPNAVNVITTSPAIMSNKSTEVNHTPQVQVINAPLKLAFKTSAFKNNYNIHRYLLQFV